MEESHPSAQFRRKIEGNHESLHAAKAEWDHPDSRGNGDLIPMNIKLKFEIWNALTRVCFLSPRNNWSPAYNDSDFGQEIQAL